MPSIVRVVISGPINERWHATPMLNDGAADKSHVFKTLEAAHQFIRLTFPDLPVRVSKRRPEVPRKCLRTYLNLLSERR